MSTTATQLMSYESHEYRSNLGRINNELARLRDQLHDAKIQGESEDVRIIEEYIKDLRAEKATLIKDKL